MKESKSLNNSRDLQDIPEGPRVRVNEFMRLHPEFSRPQATHVVVNRIAREIGLRGGANDGRNITDDRG